MKELAKDPICRRFLDGERVVATGLPSSLYTLMATIRAGARITYGKESDFMFGRQAGGGAGVTYQLNPLHPVAALHLLLRPWDDD